MVQLRILSGKQAGSVCAVKRFPCVIGRGAAAQLRLEEPGVWDRHMELGFKPAEGFTVAALPGAHVTVNERPVEAAQLKGGDVIGLGGTRIQFWLAPTRQRRFRGRELMTWFGILGLCAGQLALIYYLLR